MVIQGLISGLQQKLPLCFLAIVILLSLFSVGVIYGFGLNGPPIRSDGFGYYAYLPSVFIYHDISMEWLASTDLKSLGDYPRSMGWTGITKYETTGRYLDKYGVGVAILQAPFFLIANSLAKFFGLKANGYSGFYQICSIFSGFFYFCFGLVFLFKFLKIYFEQHTVILTLIFLTFGTGLFLYATYDGSAVPSHIYAFFAVSALLWSLTAFPYDSIVGGTLCGFLVGLLFIIRNVDVLFGILFIGYGIQSLEDLKSRFLNRSWLMRLLMAAVLFSIAIAPQLFYWKFVTGHWIIYSYQGETFNWLDPHFYDVLIGARKGLFVYYPILIFSTIGFFWSRGLVPEIATALFLFLIVNLYFVSSWSCWWYGGSFGMRPFVESTPLFAIGFCSLLTVIKRKEIRAFVEYASIICCAWTVFYMLLYWFNIVPFDGMNLLKHFWIWFELDWAFLLILGFFIFIYRNFSIHCRKQLKGDYIQV